MPADRRWEYHCVGWGGKKACLPQKHPPGLVTGIHHMLHTIHSSSIPTHINFTHIRTPQNIHTMYPSPISHTTHICTPYIYTPSSQIYTGHITYYTYTSILYILPPFYILHMCITTHHIHSTDITQTSHTCTPSSHIIHSHTHMYIPYIIYIYSHYIYMSYIYSKHTLCILQLYPYTCISCISTETTTHTHITRTNTYIPYMPKS